MQVTTIPKKTVSVIPPPAQKGPDRSKYDQLRVAPYCRVSTDSEEQLTSYTMQKRVYTEMIMGKPEWQTRRHLCRRGHLRHKSRQA